MSTACTPLDQVGASERAEMQALLARHFSGVTPAEFATDLQDKTHVVRLRDAAGALVGFSTLAYLSDLAGDAVVVSGDTIVDPAGWAQARLAPAWIRAVRALHGDDPRTLWWLLICSGLRTYRFLPVFWQHFVPGPGQGDATLLARRARLASARYGAAFAPDTGVVRLRAPQRLRPHLAAAPAHLGADAPGAFFLAANPGHGDGDELACLCALTADNLTSAGRRAWGGGWR